MAIPVGGAAITTPSVASSAPVVSATTVGTGAGMSQSALGGAVTPWGIAAMLGQSAYQLFAHDIPTIFERSGKIGRTDIGSVEEYAYEWSRDPAAIMATWTPAQYESWRRTQTGMTGIDPANPPIYLAGPEGGVVPFTEERYAELMAERRAKYPELYGDYVAVPPAAPSPTPSPGPTPTYGYPPTGSEPVPGGSMAITSPLSILGGIGDFIGSIGQMAVQTAPIWQPFAAQAAGLTQQWPQPQPQPTGVPQSMPGGAPIYAPSVRPALGLPGIDIAPGGSTPIPRNLPSSVMVPYVTPSGRSTFTVYRRQGRPLLYSGDLAACKRVKRVASKARRRVGGR
jgi:hypothetical protein